MGFLHTQVYNSLLILLLFFLFVFLGAQSQTTGYEEELNNYKAKVRGELDAYKTKVRGELDAYKARVRKELEDYKAKIRSQWQFAEIGTPSKLVIYNEEGTNKLVVDYQRNQIRFSSLKSEFNIEQAVDFIVTSLKTPIIDIVKQNKFIPADDVAFDLSPDVNQTLARLWDYSDSDLKQLALQLTTEKNRVDEINVVKQVVTDIDKTQKKLIASESNTQYIETLRKEKHQYQELIDIGTQLPALWQEKVKSNSYLEELDISRWQKSKPYRIHIAENVNRWNLPEAIVYAVAETESNFNPLAQSLAPAYGLMQIVPESAGADVRKYLYNEEGYPSVRQLFIPSVNIMYGSTYLHLLLRRYFADIKNPISRLYCSIAAYNTGPGNVAITFNGGKDKNLKSAIDTINTMVPEAVKDYLIRNLPYHETRHYLTKVLDAQQYYEQQLGA